MENFVLILKDIQKRMDEQKNDFQNMKINIIQSVNENINEKFAALDIKHQELENKITNQQNQLNRQDRYNRKKNVILYGVAEEEKGYHDLENIVVGLLNTYTKYKFENNDVEVVKRLGKRTGKTRPILITFLTMGKKIHLLKNKKYLKDTIYYIKEDFPPEVLEKRKQLKEQLQMEKDKGNKAIIQYDRLVILNNNIENKKQTYKRNMALSPEQIETSVKKNSNEQVDNSNKRKTKKNKIKS